MASGRSVQQLFAAAGLNPGGVVRWGEPIPTREAGLYLVALTDDPRRSNATLPQAPIGDVRLSGLLDACPDLTVNGARAGLSDLRAAIAAWWIPTETALYIGKASGSLRTRVGQYYRTPLGRRSPHAGGWFLKTLANLEDLWVHFAEAKQPEEAEKAALAAFVSGIAEGAATRLPDPARPFPFANLEFPPGTRKPHGIRGATCGGRRATDD